MSDTHDYPGRALGLPADGPGSLAPFGRRLVAIFCDWTLAQLVVLLVFGIGWGATGIAAFAPLAAFAVLNLLLLPTMGGTPGHQLLGLQVVSLQVDDVVAPQAWLARVPRVVPTLIRTVLLCLVVPALIFASDGRGYHDRVAGTMILRRPQSR
ncbi:MAG: RDD family protein [Ornithinimicrobium sp.]